MQPRIFTIAERPDLEERLGEVDDPWPEFIHHDEVVAGNWPLLYEEFREFQLALYDEESNAVLGKGCAMPTAWEGRIESLSGGVVEIMEEGFPGAHRPANVLCALVAVVDPGQQGRGLSGLIIEGMARTAAAASLECLIAPVRPTWKERYPLTPLERYMAWRREDGLPFDPWLRLHSRLGAEILALAPRSLDVKGTVGEWETWTGLALPESGSYVVPGALVPVEIDREHDEGSYVEPNVWMRHSV